VEINLNGEPGEFFGTHKGLRQEDPMSMLFNLVADALATIRKKGCQEGLIKGLIPELVDGGLTHLQYVDDTIIFLEVEEQSISNVKFLLYCFKNMSGLKINYQKSEVIVLGASKEESSQIARWLNCREGSLPLKYLGVHVSGSMLFVADLMEVGVKVEKRLPSWQGLLLSSGGKSVLIESSLSSLSNYIMGFYVLPGQVH
jgi:hypothetical protein